MSLSFSRLFLVVLLLSLAGFSFTASGQIIYTNIPTPVPGNVVSLGFEATSTSEFGAGVVFAPGTGRVLGQVRVLMSSWGCVSGAWFTNNCVTPPGSTFTHPITLNIYAVGSPIPGALLATRTQTFEIPYRPSADNVNCTGGNAGKWYDPVTASCKNGLATPIVFDFASQGVVLPDQVILTVAFNTTHYGYSPLGQSTACFQAGNNCPYDSLNVGAEDHLGVGSYLDPTGAYLNSSWSGAYCATGPTGYLREDPGCWGGYQPSFEVLSANLIYMAGYAANLAAGDSVFNITNTGESVNARSSNICANIYTFSPDEQLIACCSCTVTPNALVSLSARNDLVSNTLTPAVPGSIVVKMIASTGVCNAAAVSLPSIVAAGDAWFTTNHAHSGGGWATTESRMLRATLSVDELARVTAFCGFLQANGSGYGICRSCRAGGLGAVGK